MAERRKKSKTKLVWGPRKPKTSEAEAPPICIVAMADIRSVPNGELSEETVSGIMDSVARIGMQNPISVRPSEDSSIKYDVIAGHHRHAAYDRLGFQNVPVRIFTGVDAELQRHSENLHRRTPTLLEKYEDLAGYRNAIVKEDPESAPGGIQPNDKGVSKTARDRKVPRKVVQAAMAASKLGKQIKSAIASSGLANNASLIGRLAEIEAPDEQMKELLRHKGGSTVKPPPSPQIDTVTFAALIASWKKSATSGLWLRAADIERRRFISHITGGLQEDGNAWE
jgi:ParB/RepB/Spo0J family partition protein